MVGVEKFKLNCEDKTCSWAAAPPLAVSSLFSSVLSSALSYKTFCTVSTARDRSLKAVTAPKISENACNYIDSRFDPIIISTNLPFVFVIRLVRIILFLLGDELSQTQTYFSIE